MRGFAKRADSPRLIKAIAVLLAAVSILSGCALSDLALWLGKWEETGRSIDFRLNTFVLTDSFAGGKFRVSGTYTIDPYKYPKRVDFITEEVVVTFAEDNSDSVVLGPRAQAAVIRDAITRVAVSAQFPEDTAPMRLLTTFLQALPHPETVQGIYRINMYTGTYLEIELALPGDPRPKDFGQGYINRDY